MCFRPIAICVALMLVPAFAFRAGATTYNVGPTRTYHTYDDTLPALQPGDIVEFDPGTYHVARKWTASGTANQPITLRGLGGAGVYPVIDGTRDGPHNNDNSNPATNPGTMPLSIHGLYIGDLDGAGDRGRAIWQMDGSYYVIEHLEFANTHNNDTNASGIRLSGSEGTVVRDCIIHDNDNGMISDWAYVLVVEYCHIHHNSNNGFNHNLYLENDDLTVRYCHIHDSGGGINLKFRSHYAKILYNYIHDSNVGEIDAVDKLADEGYVPTSTPNSNVLMMGNVIASRHLYNAYDNYDRFINFGGDGEGGRVGTLYLINNTLIAGAGVAKFLQSTATTGNDIHIVANNNIFFGSYWINDTPTHPVPTGRLTGDHNWVQDGAFIPPGFTGTVTGGSPGFVDLANMDCRIGSWSTCRNAGIGNTTAVDGGGNNIAAVPTEYYIPPTVADLPPSSHGTRAVDAPIDIGAYEADLALSPPSAATVRIDLGTTDSPVKSGYVRATEEYYDPARGYGWITPVPNPPYHPRDRGASAGVDDMTRDFVYVDSGFDPTYWGTFHVDVPNGNYTVAVTMGDAENARGVSNIYLNGTQVDSFGTAQGVFTTHAYPLTVTGNGVDVRFYGDTTLACVNGIQIVPVGTTLDPDVNGNNNPPPVGVPMKYDFGTSSSPVMSGYTQVTETTSFSTGTGYGWTTAVDLTTRDRGATYGDDLTRDLIWTTDATFGVSLAAGVYDVTYIGLDAWNPRDSMGIEIEGTLVDTITLPENTLARRTYTVSVTDGQLTFRLHDLGGDPYSIINGLEIARHGGWSRPHPHLHRGRDRRRR